MRACYDAGSAETPQALGATGLAVKLHDSTVSGAVRFGRPMLRRRFCPIVEVTS
jgi:hypothetical protein